MLRPSVELLYINVAIILLLFVISLGPLYEGHCSRSVITKQKNRLFFVVSFALILLFIEFQFTEMDYWNYLELFNQRSDLIEPLQNWIRNKFDDFLLWRLFVWGSAFLIFVFTFERLNLDSRVYFPLFVLCCLSRFISREQLGIAIMFYGSTYMLKPIKPKVISYILGVSLIVSSYFFHSSMVFSIAMLFASFIKMTYKRLIFILVLFVPLSSFVSTMIVDDEFLNFFADFSTNTGRRIEIYTEQVTNEFNLNGLIRQLLYWSPMFLMYGDIIIRSSKRTGKLVLPRCFTYYMNYWFYMALLSFVFLWQDTSIFVSVRFWDKSLFPMVLVLSYWFSIQKPNIIMKTSLLLLLFYNCFNYFLILYKASY